jgi:hypothetical protein
VLQVDAHAAPAPVDHGVRRDEARDAGARRHVGGAVEAQHLGAHVGQQHARELHGSDVRQLEDANTGQRPACSALGHGSLKTRFAFSRRNLGHT